MLVITPRRRFVKAQRQATSHITRPGRLPASPASRGRRGPSEPSAGERARRITRLVIVTTGDPRQLEVKRGGGPAPQWRWRQVPAARPSALLRRSKLAQSSPVGRITRVIPAQPPIHFRPGPHRRGATDLGKVGGGVQFAVDPPLRSLREDRPQQRARLRRLHPPTIQPIYAIAKPAPRVWARAVVISRSLSSRLSGSGASTESMPKFFGPA